MIIRSQDKYSITDDMNISICKERPATIGDYKGENIYTKSGVFLGHYSTEEKAIKVLDMIQNAYERHKMFAITYQDGMMQKLEKCHGLDGSRELISSVFQMPSDE